MISDDYFKPPRSYDKWWLFQTSKIIWYPVLVPQITGAEGPAEFELNWAFWKGDVGKAFNDVFKTNLTLSPAIWAVVLWIVGRGLGNVESVKVQPDLSFQYWSHIIKEKPKKSQRATNCDFWCSQSRYRRRPCRLKMCTERCLRRCCGSEQSFGEVFLD